MARKKKGQLSLRLGLNDERIPKPIGILFLFFALYFFLAFSSYLFTWQIDQDKVLRFSWYELLRGDFEIANWLGRLGAIVSNTFFYWGFGLPSYFIVFIMGLLGLNWIQRVPLSRYIGTLRQSVLLMLFLSVFLAFAFGSSAFPWGGAFGEGVSSWLQNFVGTIGMIVLFVFTIAGILIWVFNPNFNELTPRKAVADSREYIMDWLSGRALQRKRRLEQREQEAPLAPLRPGQRRPPVAGTRKIGKEEEDEENQLSFDLIEDREEPGKQESLKAGDAEL